MKKLFFLGVIFLNCIFLKSADTSSNRITIVQVQRPTESWLPGDTVTEIKQKIGVLLDQSPYVQGVDDLTRGGYLTAIYTLALESANSVWKAKSHQCSLDEYTSFLTQCLDGYKDDLVVQEAQIDEYGTQHLFISKDWGKHIKSYLEMRLLEHKKNGIRLRVQAALAQKVEEERKQQEIQRLQSQADAFLTQRGKDCDKHSSDRWKLALEAYKKIQFWVLENQEQLVRQCVIAQEQQEFGLSDEAFARGHEDALLKMKAADARYVQEELVQQFFGQKNQPLASQIDCKQRLALAYKLLGAERVEKAYARLFGVSDELRQSIDEKIKQQNVPSLLSKVPSIQAIFDRYEESRKLQLVVEEEKAREVICAQASLGRALFQVQKDAKDNAIKLAHDAQVTSNTIYRDQLVERNAILQQNIALQQAEIERQKKAIAQQQAEMDQQAEIVRQQIAITQQQQAESTPVRPSRREQRKEKKEATAVQIAQKQAIDALKKQNETLQQSLVALDEEQKKNQQALVALDSDCAKKLQEAEEEKKRLVQQAAGVLADARGQYGYFKRLLRKKDHEIGQVRAQVDQRERRVARVHAAVVQRDHAIAVGLQAVYDRDCVIRELEEDVEKLRDVLGSVSEPLPAGAGHAALDGAAGQSVSCPRCLYVNDVRIFEDEEVYVTCHGCRATFSGQGFGKGFNVTSFKPHYPIENPFTGTPALSQTSVASPCTQASASRSTGSNGLFRAVLGNSSH